MSVVQESFYNIKCDSCGSLADEEYWLNSESSAKEHAQTNDFYELGGKHYCNCCYIVNEDEGIIYTADGKKFSLLDNEEVQ